MENFKFNLMVVIVFVVLGGVIYWSVSSMNNNVYYTRDIDAQEPVIPEIVIEEPPVEEPTEEPVAPENNNQNTSGEHAELISGIQSLIDNQVYMKSGSQGTRVGVVQQFLNLYFDRDSRVDNDYGPGTASAVREFQQAEGIAADGQTGPETYRRMIEWLRNN